MLKRLKKCGLTQHWGSGHTRSAPLKDNSQTPPGAPNNPAAFLCAAVQQFKPIWQLGLAADLKAGAAGGVINNATIDNGRSRANYDFGRAGNLACRSNANKSSRLHIRSSMTRTIAIPIQSLPEPR
jgi:hypothetical protein